MTDDKSTDPLAPWDGQKKGTIININLLNLLRLKGTSGDDVMRSGDDVRSMIEQIKRCVKEKKSND
jgi:hypothetical protein